MSGNGYTSTCPKCGSSMQSYSDWKPYDWCEHECFECGFYLIPQIGRMTLKEVNERRLDNDELKPLKKLKAWRDE